MYSWIGTCAVYCPVTAMNGERKPLLLPEITSRRRSSLLDSNSATNSPFNTGIPMIFPSPIPSPRPHRLSFSFVKKEDKIYDFHVLLTLLMSVIGAGMLSLPYTFVLIDSWQCVLGIVAVGISMATTATALLYTHVELAKEEEAIMHVGAGKKFCSFQSIAIIAGGRSFGYFVSFVTAIGIYGGCVGSIRIVRDIAPFLMNLFFYLTKSNHYLDDVGSQHAAMDWIMWITFIFIVFPLCLLKNLSGLRISSYLGFVFSIYLVIAIIYRSFHLLDPFGPPHNYNPLIIDPLGNHTVGMVGNGTTSIPKVPLLENLSKQVSVAPSLARFAQSISIYNYAFMMHLNLIPLFIQLRGSFVDPLSKSAEKMTKMIFTIAGFCIVLYAAFGLAASHIYGNKINGNILVNLENDPLMEIPLIAVYLTVVFGYPLLFHPLRAVIEELIFGSVGLTDIGFVPRFIKTTVLLLSQLLVAIWVPGIEVVFALTGASSCLMICFVIPAFLFTRLYPWHQVQGAQAMMTILWILVIVFTYIGVSASWHLLS